MIFTRARIHGGALAVLFFTGNIFSLTAPFLISAMAINDSTIELQWRNNDMATSGYVIQRKDSNEALFHTVDSVKSALQLSYLDAKNIKRVTLYTYQILAYNSTTVSVPSNIVQSSIGRLPPQLISATALSTKSIALTWLDQGLQTKGYIIQRNDYAVTEYRNIDSVKSPLILSYTDTIALQPGVPYSYRIIAYDTLHLQDTSNNLTVSTKPAIFGKPTCAVSWDFETPISIRISISDNSNCEAGYRIYRNEGFSGSYKLVAEIPSVNPDAMTTLLWEDNTVGLNQWYSYKAAAFKGIMSIYSNPCSTYTLPSEPTKGVVVFQKLGEFPISPWGWVAFAGDSIILKEAPSPAGKFTAINVKNSANPRFDGYVDSAALLAYPANTLIPAFLKFNVANGSAFLWRDKLLISRTSSVSMYMARNDSLIQTCQILYDTIRSFFIVGDTMLAVISGTCSYKAGGWAMSPGGLSTCRNNLRLYHLNDYGFQLVSGINLAKGRSSFFTGEPDGPHWYYDTIGTSYVHCFQNNTMIIPECNYYSDSFSPPIIHHYDTTASITVVSGTRTFIFPWSNFRKGLVHASNTGYYFSPTENLCCTDSELFVSDINILPDGYATAMANNAVYLDHGAGAIRNILLDTLRQKVYLVYHSKVSVLTYQRKTVRIARGMNKPASAKGLTITSLAYPATIVIRLPSGMYHSSISFFCLSGRCVDRIQNVGSDVVYWRPKTKSAGCYIVQVDNGMRKVFAKFIIR